jgi:hypothetical protein
MEELNHRTEKEIQEEDEEQNFLRGDSADPQAQIPQSIKERKDDTHHCCFA